MAATTTQIFDKLRSLQAAIDSLVIAINALTQAQGRIIMPVGGRGAGHTGVVAAINQMSTTLSSILSSIDGNTDDLEALTTATNALVAEDGGLIITEWLSLIKDRLETVDGNSINEWLKLIESDTGLIVISNAAILASNLLNAASNSTSSAQLIAINALIVITNALLTEIEAHLVNQHGIDDSMNTDGNLSIINPAIGDEITNSAGDIYELTKARLHWAGTGTPATIDVHLAWREGTGGRHRFSSIFTLAHAAGTVASWDLATMGWDHLLPINWTFPERIMLISSVTPNVGEPITLYFSRRKLRD